MNDNLRADLVQIETWIAKGLFDKAKDPLEKLTLEYPKEPRLWKDLGIVKHKLKKYRQAESHLINSIELDDTDVDAHCSLGGVYLSTGDYDKAMASFEKGVVLSNNKSMFSLLNFLVLKAREGKLDEVLPGLERALDEGITSCQADIKEGSNLPWAYFDLAQIYFFQDEKDQCRQALTHAVRLSNSAWQLDSASITFKLLVGSQDGNISTRAVGIVDLIDNLKNEYFTEPDKKRCFVIMPFGKKLDSADVEVNFDDVYQNFIKPTVEAEGLECIRCDEVDEAGNIHKKMFQLIWDTEVAIADVSIPNPNVFYELGIRHALRKSVTVIIRNKNAKLPFNIANMNAIEYDVGDNGIDDDAQRSIRNAISAGLEHDGIDSAVNEILNLKISDRPKVIGTCDIYSYPIKDSTKKLSLITGDLRNIRDIDVWVNSENTNMQMARFHDFAISSVIRFEGAKKKRSGNVAKDLIQEELTEIMEGERSVPEASVIATGPGELAEKYGVKAIFHVASVRGEIGKGYIPIEDIHRCVTNALVLMDNPSENGGKDDLKSILFPLLGIFWAQGNYRPILERNIQAALEYLSEHPESSVENVYFLAWSEQELALCQSVIRSFDTAGAPVRVK